MRSLVLALAVLTSLAGVAVAHPPPPPDDDPPLPERPPVEWATWVRVAYGAAPEPYAARPRLVTPGDDLERDRTQGWEAGVGADITLGVGRGGDVRIGPWAEARTSSDAVIGGELVFGAVPRRLEMFWYEGEGILILRGGGNRSVRTAAVSYGYRAPWNLFRPARGATRYMIGVRMVASVTQAVDDPNLWSATLGLETEPVGALRYLLGIRSWY